MLGWIVLIASNTAPVKAVIKFSRWRRQNAGWLGMNMRDAE
jgi:hypothetical protein